MMSTWSTAVRVDCIVQLNSRSGGAESFPLGASCRLKHMAGKWIQLEQINFFSSIYFGRLKVRRQLRPFPDLGTLHSVLLYSSIKQPIWIHTDHVCHVILDSDIYSSHHTMESIPTVYLNPKQKKQYTCPVLQKQNHRAKNDRYKIPRGISLAPSLTRHLLSVLCRRFIGDSDLYPFSTPLRSVSSLHTSSPSPYCSAAQMNSCSITSSSISSSHLRFTISSRSKVILLKLDLVLPCS